MKYGSHIVNCATWFWNRRPQIFLSIISTTGFSSLCFFLFLCFFFIRCEKLHKFFGEDSCEEISIVLCHAIPGTLNDKQILLRRIEKGVEFFTNRSSVLLLESLLNFRKIFFLFFENRQEFLLILDYDVEHRISCEVSSMITLRCNYLYVAVYHLIK